MKRIVSIIVLMMICFSSFSQNNRKGMKFEKTNLDEAIKKAQKVNKLVFVDCYTNWCVPCLRMAKEVFTNPEVGEFYNKNFVNVKIDMESKEGNKIQKKFKIEGFPTLLYLDYNGKLIMRKLGGRSAPDFIKLGKTVLVRHDTEVENKPKGK